MASRSMSGLPTLVLLWSHEQTRRDVPPIPGFGIGDMPSWFRCDRLEEGLARYRPSWRGFRRRRRPERGHRSAALEPVTCLGGSAVNAWRCARCGIDRIGVSCGVGEDQNGDTDSETGNRWHVCSGSLKVIQEVAPSCAPHAFNAATEARTCEQAPPHSFGLAHELQAASSLGIAAFLWPTAHELTPHGCEWA